MNIRKAKKLYKAGTLFKVEGTHVVGMSLGYRSYNEIESFNLIDVVTGEPVARCDGKCRLATKREQDWYWAGIAAYAHLSSAGSEEWKKQHGFKTEDKKELHKI
jgi:hypothetical protein